MQGHSFLDPQNGTSLKIESCKHQLILMYNIETCMNVFERENL